MRSAVKRSILLVDDESDIIEYMTSLIEDELEETLELHSAKDGVEALTLVEKHTFDLIVTDLRMPRMDGMELVSQIREGDTPNKLVPILFFSAYLVQVKGLDETYDKIWYMEKPLDEQPFIRCVKMAISSG